MRDFRNLRIWQASHRLALDIQLRIQGARARQYPGLRTQLLRAAASIPANIAEGCGKSTHAELARYADIALGSTIEVENHLRLAGDSGVIDPDSYIELASRLEELRRMLHAFIRAVRSRPTAQ